MDKTFFEEIKTNILKSPVWRFFDPERKWYCPFCAKRTSIKLPSGQKLSPEMINQIGAHLISCGDFQGGRGKAKDLEYIKLSINKATQSKKKKSTIAERIETDFLNDPLWQLKDDEGIWYCPCCAQPTSVKIPESPVQSLAQKTIQNIVKSMQAHINSCKAYQKAPGVLTTPKEIEKAIAYNNRAKNLINQITENLRTNEVWRVKDSKGKWLCPYCKKVIDKINILSRFLMLEVAPRRIVEHLSKECPVYQEDISLTVTLGQLQAIVKKQDPSLQAKDEKEDLFKEIREEVAAVRAQVKTSKELEQSLEEAYKKQQKMLPTVPVIEGFEFECLYKTCHHISGDFYDFVKISEDEIGMVIGDVAGHGVDAGLIMGMVKKVLNIRGKSTSSPRETLEFTNAEIYPDLDRKTFITTIYGVFNTTKKIFKFIMAGHNSLILYNSQRKPSLMTFLPSGIALGINKGPLFSKSLKEEQIDLKSGDRIILYTDGVVETIGPNQEMFGFDRFADLIKKYGNHEAKYLLYMIETSLTEFMQGSELKDDITVICVRMI